LPGLLVTSLHAQPAARSFSSYYFFGDSLTDNGNLFFYTGQPPAPYYNGRFSNGPTYAEYLKPGVAAVSTTASTVKTNLVFAFAGATAVGSTPVPASLPVQLAMFQGRAITPTGNDIFFVLAGANDVLNAIATPATQNFNGVAAAANAASTSVANTVRSLATAGAKNIVVMNLPNIAQTPRFTTGSGAPAASLAEAGSLTFNSSLRANIVATNMPADVNVTIVDLRSLLNTIIRNPATFGFTVTNQSVIDILGAGGNPGNIDGYVFWDGIHPTTKTSAILANILTEVINPEFVLGTAGTQGTALLATLDLAADAVDSRLGTIRSGGALERTADGFISYNYKEGNRDFFSYQPGLDYKASVVTAGFDYNFTSKFTAGLAFGADEVRVGTLAAIGPGSFNLKGLTTTLYTLWRGDRIFAEATANFGRHDVRSISRPTTMGGFRTEGKTSADSYGGSVKVGADFASGSFHFIPFVGVRYNQGDLRAYDESGVTGLNFSFGKQSVSDTTGLIGLAADWAVSNGAHPVVLSLSGVYASAMGSDDRTLTGRLVDNISQTTAIRVQDGNGDNLKLGVRLTGTVSKRWGWSVGFSNESRDDGDDAKQYSVALHTGF
jgi:outer membrane lipase/esterase